jgi:hypothetical protein
MAETMTAPEALQRFIEAAPDSEFAQWWATLHPDSQTIHAERYDNPRPFRGLGDDGHIQIGIGAGIVAAVRALSAREEQVRREALVEGARWGLGKSIDELRLGICAQTKEGKPCDHEACSGRLLHIVRLDAVDPAAILEREKVKK